MTAGGVGLDPPEPELRLGGEKAKAFTTSGLEKARTISGLDSALATSGLDNKVSACAGGAWVIPSCSGVKGPFCAIILRSWFVWSPNTPCGIACGWSVKNV